MRTAYRVFAYIIAAEVVIQAAAVAFAISGLFNWIDKDGGTLDKAAIESDVEFTGVVGFIIHGINGMMLIPLIALIFLIISFFAKVPGGVMWAGVTLALVVLQVTLGLLGSEGPVFGLLHGANALAIFSVAVMAGMRAKTDAPARATAAA
jgi:hypothetical protein